MRLLESEKARYPFEMDENTEIFTAARQAFQPNAAQAKTLNLRPESGGQLKVVKIKGDRYQYADATARSAIPWTFRRFAVPAQKLQDGSGEPEIFLIEDLISYQDGQRLLYAPLYLTPIAMTADERFEANGPRQINNELAQQLADRGFHYDENQQAKNLETVVSRDPSYQAVTIIPAGPRRLLRLLEAAEQNIGAAGALRFLVDADAATAIAPLAQFIEDKGHPLDHDQQRAVEAILAGENMVVHGPPGCGKSETIATAACQAAKNGKSVLIASSVRSALDVAQRRIDEKTNDPAVKADYCDLDDLCKTAPPDTPYDLLIIDEATRINLHEALLFAARAEQIVVCGDGQQIQPNNGEPSVFDHMAKIAKTKVTLTHHYRSRDERLIFHSNIWSYQRQLKTVPSIEAESQHGTSLFYVKDGEEEKTVHGAVNKKEAEAIAARVGELYRHGATKSLCCIAFTDAQAKEIDKLVRRSVKIEENELFFSRTPIEAQGEEREIVLVSTTFAPTNGAMRESFGRFDTRQPANQINVALTRARSRCEIFTSMTAEAFKKTTNNKSAIAFGNMLADYAMVDRGGDLLQVFQSIKNLMQQRRQNGDELINLGLIHAWRRAEEKQYQIAIIRRDNTQTPEEWLAAAQQLKASGWPVIDCTDAQLGNYDPKLQKEIKDILWKTI